MFSGFEGAWATRMQGFVFLLLLLVAIVFVRSRLSPTAQNEKRMFPDYHVFRQPNCLLVTIAAYFLEWGLFIPATHLTSYCLSSGAMSSSHAYQIMAIFNAAPSAACKTSDVWADRMRRYNVMIITVFFCMSTSMALWLPGILFVERDTHHKPVLALSIAYSILMGLVSGSSISLAPVCVGAL